MTDIHAFMNVIHREIARAVSALVRRDEVGVFDSYDKNTHSVKVTLQPYGHLTGWLPIGNAHVGNNYGVAIGPQAGDQFLVGFRNGDKKVPFIKGRVYSDSNRPPIADSGEILLQNQNFTKIFFDKNNNLTILHSSGSSIKFDNAGTMEINGVEPITITVGGFTAVYSNSGLAMTGGTITHNGKDIGSDHTHTLVVTGTDPTGPPS